MKKDEDNFPLIKKSDLTQYVLNDPSVLNLDKLKPLQVRVDNQLVQKAFPIFSRGWSAFDIDLWNFIETQTVDEKNNIINIPFHYIKKYLFNKSVSYSRIKKKVQNSLDKFIDIRIRLQQVSYDEKTKRNVEEILTIPVFSLSYIRADGDSLVAQMQVSSNATMFFNQLKHEYTKFRLLESKNISNKYVKRLYMELKSWRITGHRHEISISKFRELLDVPKSYRSSHITERILHPALIELAPVFKQFHIREHKVSRPQGGVQIKSVEFFWIPEEPNSKELGLSNIVIETHAIINILTNKYLSLDEKFESIDSYRHKKAGTTKKIYTKNHPNTFFVPTSPKEFTDGQSKYHRTILKNVKSLKPEALNEIIKMYEELHFNGLLKQYDIDDLKKMELQLVLKIAKKVQDFNDQTLKNYFQLHTIENTFAFQELRVLFSNYVNANYQKDHPRNIFNFDAEEISEDLNTMIDESFAANKQHRDHRNLEFTDTGRKMLEENTSDFKNSDKK